MYLKAPGLTLNACPEERDFERRPTTKQLLRIMKLTAIILLSACLTASAKGYSQKVSLSEKEVPLEKIFKEIKRQTGYSFFFNEDLLAKAAKVTVIVKDVSLQQALEICFKDQSLTYSIVGNTVVIEEKKKVIKDENTNLPPPPIDVKGKVLNENSNPVEGVTVSIKGTNIATATNANGEFSLSSVDANAVLVFTGTNVETFELKVNGRAELAIKLKTKVSKLDEVQIIGYGQESKRYAVGSVSTIKSEQIEKQPVMNVLQALQGLVPGVTINPTSGAPGGQVNIQIRGQNTISNGLGGQLPIDQPLIIIDGVPYAPQNIKMSFLPKLGNEVDAGMSPLNSLNPSDIESISFLKDADATSIYGSQGLNGVMLITTKKGKPGKPSLNINVYAAPQKSAKVIEMLNTEQYRSLRKEAFANDGITPTVVNAPELLLFDSTKYTNWFKKLYGETANNTTINATLSGGTLGTTYVLSAGYAKSTYNFPGDFKNERATLHTGFSHNPAGSRLSVDFGTDFSYNTDNSTGAPYKALLLPPNLPDLVNPDGSLVWEYKGLDLGLNLYQVYGGLRSTSNSKNTALNSTLRLGYQLLPGLRITSNIGYSYFLSDLTQTTPNSSLSPGLVALLAMFNISLQNAYFINTSNQVLNLEPQAEYQKKFGKGRIIVLAGGTYKRQTSKGRAVFASGYANEALLGSPNGASTTFLSESYTPYRYVAVFGRVNYVHADKYILNLTGRRDGSGNFGPDRQFGNFGSAGLGWILSEEKFFKNAIPFINYAKLSTNYGTVGSDGISAYLYQDYWGRPFLSSTFQGVTPYQSNNLFNPDFGWGIKKMWNAALDISLLNRINLNATWYRNRTSNQLSSMPLPTQTGFTTVLGNMDATVQDMGWEFSLSSENIKGRNFTWTSTFNIFLNRNKLIEYKDLEKSRNRYYYFIGRSTSTKALFKFAGVNDTTGVFQFYKADGKTAVYVPTDVGAIGLTHDRGAFVDLEPRFTGGFSNTFVFKGFELSFLFQFAKQTGLNHLYNLVTADFHLNKPAALLDLTRWQKPGDKAEIQRLTTTSSSAAGNAYYNFQNSTAVYGDASYIRLKNLSLSYNLPETWLKKARLKNGRLFINANNLLTITGYKVGDPEMPGNLLSIPPQRTIAGGISLTF